MPAPAQPAEASGTHCATAMVNPVGPFQILDNRTVMDAERRTFISRGTTVPGLSSPDLTAPPSTGIDKINATVTATPLIARPAREHANGR